ncbi:MAG: phosphoadenosine phosphosulfate reductase family protein [Christensenellaceae bacterium]|nr:phosphoadenosine phosphosulfate reductase family protein [Christensenellaceae bacterium]
MQALPLHRKIHITAARIVGWYTYFNGNVYVAFSGGKDSTVLLDMARKLFPDIGAMFANTGLEYPEIQKFVKSFDNVTIVRPKMRFDEVIKKYGYPMISKEVSKAVSAARRLDSKFGQVCRVRLEGKHTTKDGMLSKFNIGKYKPLQNVDFMISDMCCFVMKKTPSKIFEKQSGKVGITAQMANESRLRKQSWINHGCNSFDSTRPISNPMSFWTEQDVLQYIKAFDLPIAPVYGDVVYTDRFGYEYPCSIGGCADLKTTGCSRTGCIFCGYGAHMEKGENRFQRLKRTHPKQYAYCMNGGEYNEDGLWIPNKDGLGMAHVLDELNRIYGSDFIPYE